MPSIDDYYSSDLLKSDDIKEEIKLTIVKVEPQKIGEQTKLFVTFDEIEKRLVLNQTNSVRLSKIAKTKDYTKWSGLEITLYTIWTTFKKEEVKAIRVKFDEKE